MPKQRWTIVVVPPEAGETKSLRISLTWLRIGFGVLAVCGLIAVGVGYSAVSRAVALSQLDRLERRNELLAEELIRAEQILATVGDSIARIQDRDRTMRLLAGLIPTDPDVQQAGIGGPIGEWTDEELRLAEGAAGQRALNMRVDLDALVRRANILAGSFGVALDTLNQRVDHLRRTPSIEPTEGFKISHFSDQRMHPIHHVVLPHEGLDIVADVGAPVLAPARGRVSRIFTNGGYGLMVVIDHGVDPMGRRLVTRYGHLSSVNVRVGEAINRGEKIAEVGESGVVTGPHLHYEVLVNGVAVDPIRYILPKVIVD
jgi:murein DD-endopeptidase MepM/ murein hydrolase activator NlpD